MKKNFLLGKGERLTEHVKIVPGGGPKVDAYTFAQAKERLAPMIRQVSTKLDALPQNACPNDEAIATLTLNPEYIAKSYYPSDLLRSIGLETVGSRAKQVKPERRSAGREPEESVTTELFVKGPRSAFRNWSNGFNQLEESSFGAKSIVKIESLSVPEPADKIKSDLGRPGKGVYEVVLHADEDSSESYYLGMFRKYLRHLNLNTTLDKRFYAGGLCFLELEASPAAMKEVAKFSLVRAIRSMPTLRLLRPTIRTSNKVSEIIKLPNMTALDPAIKVAIFDGGIPKSHPLTRWVTPIETPGIGKPERELLEHGVGVTSAFLFGHINPKQPLERPYSNVDHYRVLDNVPGQNPYELYDVLERIMNVLKSTEYDFINLSLGPRLPIEDDDVHAWTAVLDEYLSSGKTFAAIAVGNDGDGDPLINANRIQVPSDCVNALGIGACDVPDNDWQRAPYSSVGPGRSPGIVKPDLVEFGGSTARPFLVVDVESGTKVTGTGGTSYAAPSTMRMGTGVRAHFGNSLNALAIQTLLVHCAEESNIPKEEVGFGRVPRLLDDMVVCGDDEVRVVYQGRISASKYIRASIPLPAGDLEGMVTIKATLCYATAVDAHHPGNYTKSGLEIVFRPNKTVRREDALHASTKSFFGRTEKGLTEEELRKDAYKWENCHHAKKRMRGSTLNEPVFDIHYNARSEGQNDLTTQEIKYALVVTVKAPKIQDLYNQVVRRYATQLEALQPVIDIPVRV